MTTFVDFGEVDADQAWQFYRETGVIIPDFAGEIAERRRIQRKWASNGVTLI